METFRKWLNKPKADDKSLLARFYHADHALSAVASELDSFDGRAEPDRCARLVSRLRQGQDKVLSITNHIMEELLSDDRAPRAFRAKFPEEVLQENLAGQLWFGAECLAAGSSIMNRELESTAMRPLAQAVTKSLDNVRNLLRDQCLRNNIPNSQTLKLDINDSATEQLYESLKIFDRLFAEFELRYVSAMVQVKSKQEFEMQELICVLFSETLQRALTINLLEQDQVDSYDPSLMFSIPRLAIITGLVIYPKGPLNMDMPADNLSEMFRPFRTILIKIRDLLRTLNKNELYQLEKLLCTNEEIHLKNLNTKEFKSKTTTLNNSKTTSMETSSESTKICDDESKKGFVANKIDNSCNSGVVAPSSADSIGSLNKKSKKKRLCCTNSNSENEDHEDVVIKTAASSMSDSFGSSTTADISSDWSTSDEQDNHDNSLIVADCGTGYLIPNTNFGNLLQSTDDPLTDNFIGSDDEYVAAALGITGSITPSNDNSDNLENNNVRLEEITKDSFENNSSAKICETSANSSSIGSGAFNLNSVQQAINSINVPQKTRKSSIDKNNLCDKSSTSTTSSTRNSHYSKIDKNSRPSINDNNSQSVLPQRVHHHNRHHHSTSSSSKHSNSSRESYSRHHSKRRSNRQQILSSSSGDTSSSLSDGDQQHEVKLALRPTNSAGRMKFKSTESLLHRLFVCIAGVADQLQTNFAPDLRQILRSVFLMNTSPNEDELPKITTPKSKDPEQQELLFEFRPSANDVIQPRSGQQNNSGSGGSNQSIYSTAEEVNPECDNVFANDSTSSLGRNSLDSGCPAAPSRNNLGRSQSLGEDQNETQERRTQQQQQQQQIPQERRRLSSQGSSSCQSDSSSSSPINSSPRDIYFQQQPQRQISTANHHSSQQQQQQSSSNTPSRSNMSNKPPEWIRDEDAPRCMSCTVPFTAFRRRHHCRNCGGVFCGQCSNVQAPLPKYGLTKAVRVCRDCYIREISTTNSAGNTSITAST